MLEIERLSWQIISLINMCCSSSSLLGVFCLKSFIFILYTYGHIDWATTPHWLFFPCGLPITTECFTHCRLSAATSAFIQNFLQPVMVTQHLQSKNLKGGSRRSLAWGKSAAQNETLFQIQETLFPHIGPRSHQDICYANSTVHPSELKCKVVLY